MVSAARVPIDNLSSAETLFRHEVVFEHCGEPMVWKGSSTSWEGRHGSGWESTVTTWACGCGAALSATVRLPS